jgi:hypothetical protein
MDSPSAAPSVPPRAPDISLAAELRGTVLLFVLTLLVTAGVALCASAVVAAVG